MTLVSKMTTLYERVYPISDRFGVPSHCDFSYRDRSTGVTTVVTPRPQVSSPPKRSITGWLETGVDVNKDTVMVTGISRSYGGILEGNICTINGKQHTIIWVDRDQTISYSILAQPERIR